jgi:putative nucleotidyltransferase with HDIG domain
MRVAGWGGMALDDGFLRKTTTMNRYIHDMVEAFATALDAKHPYTRGHSDRVADLAFALARRMGLPRRNQYYVHVAGHLHDIGKIGIPDEVLGKTGRLTGEEYAIIRQHSVLGYEILAKARLFRPIAAVVRHHHERFDGGGYPDGLKGGAIPLAARIICLADAYDAMTSARSYRQALTPAEAVREIADCSGTQFDPAVVQAFLAWTAGGAAG